MLTRHYTPAILTLLLLMGILSANGQANQSSTLQRDLTLEKDYVPSVDLPAKQFLLPGVEPVSPTKRAADYSLSENPATLQGFYNPLPAPTVSIDYPAGQKWGYFSFAGGSKSAFLGDAQVNLLRKPKQTLDVRLLHRSIFGEITDAMGVEKRSYMNQNRLMANYTLHLPAHVLTVSLGERYDAWNYYGSWKTPSTPVDPAAVTLPGNQWLSDTEYSAEISSNPFSLKNLSYRVRATGHLFFLGKGINAPGIDAKTKGGRENEFRVTGNAAYALNNGLSFGANVDYVKFGYRNPSSYSLFQEGYDIPLSTRYDFADQSWLQVNPFARFAWKQWMVSAGFNVAFPSLESERVKWSPTLEGSTSLSDKAAFRVSLGGNVVPQSYREGFDRNPYLDPSIRLKSEFQVLNATATIDYRPIKNLRVSPKVEYAKTNDKAFFYNAMPGTSDIIHTGYGSLFSAEYMNENRLTVGTDVYFNFRSKLRFFTRLQYNHYINHSKESAFDLQLKNNGRKAWYQPGFNARIRLDVSILDNLTAFVDYQLAALRYAPTPTEFMYRMSAVNDLQLGVSWEPIKRVQLYVRLNNLLDQRYEPWFGYKTHGFSALIGGYVSF